MPRSHIRRGNTDNTVMIGTSHAVGLHKYRQKQHTSHHHIDGRGGLSLKNTPGMIRNTVSTIKRFIFWVGVCDILNNIPLPNIISQTINIWRTVQGRGPRHIAIFLTIPYTPKMTPRQDKQRRNYNDFLEINMHTITFPIVYNTDYTRGGLHYTNDAYSRLDAQLLDLTMHTSPTAIIIPTLPQPPHFFFDETDIHSNFFICPSHIKTGCFPPVSTYSKRVRPCSPVI